jgi:Ribosome biogenesis protein SLX9
MAKKRKVANTKSFNMHDISAQLEESESQPIPLKHNKKLKKKKVNKLSEIKRFQQVLKVKEFQANPLRTIQTHLENTLAK